MDKPTDLVSVGFYHHLVIYLGIYYTYSRSICVDEVVIDIWFYIIEPNFWPSDSNPVGEGLFR